MDPGKIRPAGKSPAPRLAASRSLGSWPTRCGVLSRRLRTSNPRLAQALRGDSRPTMYHSSDTSEPAIGTWKDTDVAFARRAPPTPGRHIVPFLRVVGGITSAACATYQRKRLGEVLRATVKKERSTLRRFLGWAAEQGYLEQATELPALPRRALGTRYEKRRRGRATEMTPEECRAIINKLPPWSTSKKRRVLSTTAGAPPR